MVDVPSSRVYIDALWTLAVTTPGSFSCPSVFAACSVWHCMLLGESEPPHFRGMTWSMT